MECSPVNNLDCDDTDDNVYPDAVEICDNTDNDCNGDIDDWYALDASDWYKDLDADGHGDADDTTQACEPPEGYVASSDDCDDSRDDVHPGADEYCDDIDHDCDADI